MAELALAPNTTAPLQNVGLFSALVERVQNRGYGLPGLACFSGPSGYGKTQSAIYAANKHRAFHVRVMETVTRRSLCQDILAEIGIVARGTAPDMIKEIGRALAQCRRPLILDDAHNLAAKQMTGAVLDIYERSFGAIVLVGEEELPQTLSRVERVHGRMLDWVQARPVSLADTKHLAKLYCRGVEVADDLLVEVHEAAKGSVRRVCVNLGRNVLEAAQVEGLSSIDLKQYRRLKPDGLFTGEPPARRR
jgi:DNA transposition AAA+ family ATPase